MPEAYEGIYQYSSNATAPLLSRENQDRRLRKLIGSMYGLLENFPSDSITRNFVFEDFTRVKIILAPEDGSGVTLPVVRLDASNSSTELSYLNRGTISGSGVEADGGEEGSEESEVGEDGIDWADVPFGCCIPGEECSKIPAAFSGQIGMADDKWSCEYDTYPYDYSNTTGYAGRGGERYGTGCDWTTQYQSPCGDNKYGYYSTYDQPGYWHTFFDWCLDLTEFCRFSCENLTFRDINCELHSVNGDNDTYAFSGTGEFYVDDYKRDEYGDIISETDPETGEVTYPKERKTYYLVVKGTYSVDRYQDSAAGIQDYAFGYAGSVTCGTTGCGPGHNVCLSRIAEKKNNPWSYWSKFYDYDDRLDKKLEFSVKVTGNGISKKLLDVSVSSVTGARSTGYDPATHYDYYVPGPSYAVYYTCDPNYHNYPIVGSLTHSNVTPYDESDFSFSVLGLIHSICGGKLVTMNTAGGDGKLRCEKDENDGLGATVTTCNSNIEDAIRNEAEAAAVAQVKNKILLKKQAIDNQFRAILSKPLDCNKLRSAMNSVMNSLFLG